MSDLRFLEELGTEFERIAGGRSASPVRRRRARWVRLRQHAAEAVVIGLSLAVVVGVASVLLATRARGPSGPAAGRSARIVFRASVLDPRVGLGPAIERSTGVLQLRLGSVFPNVGVSRAESNIVVRGVPGDSRARVVALAVSGHLEFYDWEANVLLPDGKTVASALMGLPPGYQNNPKLLSSEQKRALLISEGAGAAGAGGMSLYDAVGLASRQPARVSADNARHGPQYYMFGAPGSTACMIAGRYYRYIPASGEHCLLSGPDATLQALYRGLPRGIRRSQGRVLAVPQGTVVLEAAPPSFSRAAKIFNPSAQFYVLKDHAVLSVSEITHPHQSTDQSGAPDVTFGFTTKGKADFHKLTRQVAERGQQVSGLGPQLNQHFAVALDQQLTTVPQIDFKVYPNGIIDAGSADITAGFTTRSAKTFATLLRFGPLPVSLVPR